MSTPGSWASGKKEKEKMDTLAGMQNIQAVLVTIQEGMRRMEEKMTHNQDEMKKNQEQMQKNIIEIKEEMKSIDERIAKIQKDITVNEQKIQKLEGKTDLTDARLEVIENTQIVRNRDTEDALAHLEMEKDSFFLRFQNIEEEKEEELGEIMVDLIASAIQKDKNEVRNGIDEVYRTFTNYARRNKLPKEVHVRFTKKSIKEEVYWKMRRETVKYKGREVIILKQTPKRIRDRRSDYNFLARRLNKLKIKFRWLIPEGVMITWEGRKFKVDDLEKAQDFIDQHLGEEDEQEGRGRYERKNETEKEKRPVNNKEKENDKKEQGKEGTAESSQRVTRSATKAAEKQLE